MTSSFFLMLVANFQSSPETKHLAGLRYGIDKRIIKFISDFINLMPNRVIFCHFELHLAMSNQS